MKAGEFRKFVFRAPFAPVDIRLRSGEPVIARHLDYLNVVRGWAGVFDPKNGLPIVFQIREVVSLRYVNGANGRRQR